MTNLNLYTGPLQSYYFFSKQIIESVLNQKNDYLVILPVNRAVRLFKKTLIESSKKKIVIDPSVVTFEELLLQIYRTLPGMKRIITRDMLYLILDDIMTDKLSELQYFSSGGSCAENLIKKTADMIHELRRFGYDAEEFENLQLIEKQTNPLKFENFNSLLSTLDDRLNDQLIDEPFAMHTAAKILTLEQFRSVYPDIENVYISGYGLFTPAMYLAIEKFSSWFNVHLKLEYCPGNPELFLHTHPAMERFSAMGARIISQKMQDDLSGLLFNRQISQHKKCNQVDRISVQGLKDREEEIEFIATQIRHLNLEGSVPLHKMALTFSNLERYVPLIRQKFRDFQIPFNLSTGYSLNQSPLIRTFLNCLNLIDGGFEYNEVIRFFINTFIQTPEELNPVLLRKILTENRVRYISAQRLNHLSGILERTNGSGRESYRDKQFQVELISNLLQVFFEFPLKTDISSLRSAYIKLLNKLNLISWYDNENSLLSEREKENEFRAFNRFMKLLDKLTWTLNYLHGSNEISLKYFSRSLQTAVSQAVYNLTEWPDFGVQIMPRLEILALDFEVLMVGGLVDGTFPRSSTRDVFFNDIIREEMNLLASEELLDQDRFIFYSLLDSSADKIFLTYPKYQEDRALTPSTFLSDLREAAEVSINAYQEEIEVLNPKKIELNLGLEIQKLHADTSLSLAGSLFSQTPVEDALWLMDKIKNIRQRIIADHFSLTEGNLSPVHQIRDILKRKYAFRTWSVTQLEQYAFCPMQFFMDRVLKIEDEPEFEEDLNNLERGNLIHDILFRFFFELKKIDKLKNPADHKQLLFEIAEDIFSQMPFRGFFWDLERAVYFGTNQNSGLLQTFLDYDQNQISQTGFSPHLFEFAFGYTYGSQKDQSSNSRSVILKSSAGQIKINGKIDRIDVDPNGSALIFDYKTGKQAASVQAKDILAGQRFQLPLYLLAFNELNPNLQGVYGGYYLVKDAENCERIDVITDKSRVRFVKDTAQAALPHKKLVNKDGEMLSFNELLDHSLNTAIEKTEELQQGNFRHTFFPDDIVCQQYCEFRRMCQKNTGKLRAIRDNAA